MLDKTNQSGYELDVTPGENMQRIYTCTVDVATSKLHVHLGLSPIHVSDLTGRHEDRCLQPVQWTIPLLGLQGKMQ